MLYAVIDIGSTSVRLMLTDGARVQKKVNTTRLAENMGDNNLLQTVNLERTAQAVAEYYFIAATAGATEIFAYATEAVRSARNKHAFCDRVRELCGLDVDVLDKLSEAETGFAGVGAQGDCCVIDMGGASTEVTVGGGEGIKYCKSLPYGIVRLSAVEKAKTDMYEFISDKIKAYGEVPAFTKVYAIGGTITTMAAMLNELTVYDPNIVNGSKITLKDIEDLYAKVKPMTFDERRKLAGLPEKRADIIAPGILMYGLLLRYLCADGLTVSEGDGTEGYLIAKGLLPAGFKAKYENIL